MVRRRSLGATDALGSVADLDMPNSRGEGVDPCLSVPAAATKEEKLAQHSVATLADTCDHSTHSSHMARRGSRDLWKFGVRV
ncbi:hypothetical protein GCM10007147_01040 [Nocardiopsis kunsanensis]|uniref:Uncharacterized protein n=1 Tax=Nocardiopsis kunsanensis TaxID=141693 RepID=A0A918X6J6_9ACTN|nr:hypothetical protein GCM10007147_01040 [Nocardiopsis kunsanensis]